MRGAVNIMPEKRDPFAPPPESMDAIIILACSRVNGSDPHTYRSGYVRTHWGDFEWWMPLPEAPVRPDPQQPRYSIGSTYDSGNTSYSVYDNAQCRLVAFGIQSRTAAESIAAAYEASAIPGHTNTNETQPS